jgi:membrane dipeptidase
MPGTIVNEARAVERGRAAVYNRLPMAEISERAQDLHRDAVVVDLHADTLELVALGYDLALEHRPWAALGRILGHVDIPRLARGGVSGQFFGVVIPPWSTTASAIEKVRRQAGLLDRLCAEHEQLLLAQAAEDVLAAHASGRTAALLGVEGSYGLVRDPSLVAEIAALGVRYLGPAHLAPSRAAPSNLFPGSARLGAQGRELLAELERRSVIVDLAHLAREAFLEACSMASRPPLVSHTGVKAIHGMWRNIDDVQIRAVADRGGVVGVIMTPGYLGLPGADGVAAHLAHLIRVGGEALPALGSDFDGLVRPPDDVRDAAGLPAITEALLRHGLPEGAIRRILGENVLRLLRDVPPARPS